jgi:SAM-dependent methyltransferase
VTGDLWGEDVARGYDDDSSMFSPELLAATTDVLVDLADGRRALEFAIGTGRVGVPLAERGVPVAGIEMSPAMAAKLREKMRPGSAAAGIELVMGDMASARVAGEFGLVYLVYNTITNLLDQDEQVECFRNAAAHLVSGGFYLVEVGVPQLQRLPPGERVRPFHVGREHLGFDSFDLVGQRLTSHHYRFTGDGRASRFESHHRYAWPAEYDLMARIAGLERFARWSGWDRAEFTAESTSHVSVWRKP